MNEFKHFRALCSSQESLPRAPPKGGGTPRRTDGVGFRNQGNAALGRALARPDAGVACFAGPQRIDPEPLAPLGRLC